MRKNEDEIIVQPKKKKEMRFFFLKKTFVFPRQKLSMAIQKYLCCFIKRLNW